MGQLEKVGSKAVEGKVPSTALGPSGPLLTRFAIVPEDKERVEEDSPRLR